MRRDVAEGQAGMKEVAVSEQVGSAKKQAVSDHASETEGVRGGLFDGKERTGQRLWADATEAEGHFPVVAGGGSGDDGAFADDRGFGQFDVRNAGIEGGEGEGGDVVGESSGGEIRRERGVGRGVSVKCSVNSSGSSGDLRNAGGTVRRCCGQRSGIGGLKSVRRLAGLAWRDELEIHDQHQCNYDQTSNAITVHKVPSGGKQMRDGARIRAQDHIHPDARGDSGRCV